MREGGAAQQPSERDQNTSSELPGLYHRSPDSSELQCKPRESKRAFGSHSDGGWSEWDLLAGRGPATYWTAFKSAASERRRNKSKIRKDFCMKIKIIKCDRILLELIQIEMEGQARREFHASKLTCGVQS